MTSFSPSYLRGLAMPPRLARMSTAAAMLRGKQALWAQTKPEVLRELRRIAFIESTESSSRMENIEVGPQTFTRIMRHSEPPDAQSRPQAELAGYRDALSLISGKAADMAPTENILRQLHKALMGDTISGGGDDEMTPNDIVENEGKGRYATWRLS